MYSTLMFISILRTVAAPITPFDQRLFVYIHAEMTRSLHASHANHAQETDEQSHKRQFEVDHALAGSDIEDGVTYRRFDAILYTNGSLLAETSVLSYLMIMFAY